jgi:hypothetical protein
MYIRWAGVWGRQPPRINVQGEESEPPPDYNDDGPDQLPSQELKVP